MIEVIATRLGYYGDKRRGPGDRFEVSKEAHLSARWMQRVDGKPIEPKKTKDGKPIGPLPGDANNDVVNVDSPEKPRNRAKRPPKSKDVL